MSSWKATRNCCKNTSYVEWRKDTPSWLYNVTNFPFWSELWQRLYIQGLFRSISVSNISATTYLDKSFCWLYVPYQPKTFLVDNKSKADSSHFPYLEFLYHQTKLLKVQKRLNTVDKECWYMKNSTAVL